MWAAKFTLDFGRTALKEVTEVVQIVGRAAIEL
jgi:hypothetical protein